MLKSSKILAMFLLLVSAPAFASGGQLPTMEVFINNLLALPNIILDLMRMFLMIFGVLGFAWGVFLIHSASKIAVGEESKFIKLKNPPKLVNVLLIMVVSTLMYALGDGFALLSQVSKSITGTSMASPYSIVTYKEGADDTALQLIAEEMFYAICRIMGFLAFYLGLRQIWLAGHGVAEKPWWKAIGFFILGGLIYNIVWTYDLIFVNTLGIDFIRFIF